jgi:hypothetical protein
MSNSIRNGCTSLWVEFSNYLVFIIKIKLREKKLRGQREKEAKESNPGLDVSPTYLFFSFILLAAPQASVFSFVNSDRVSLRL